MKMITRTDKFLENKITHKERITEIDFCMALDLTLFSLIFRCLSVPFYGDAENAQKGKKSAFGALFGRTA